MRVGPTLSYYSSVHVDAIASRQYACEFVNWLLSGYYRLQD